MTEEQIIQQPEAVEQVSEQPQAVVEETIKPEVKDSWETDKRWGKIWKTPEDTYKSYKEMEKMYPSVKQRAEQYEKVFKENNLSLEDFPKYVKEYQELKDPNNPTSQKAQYFDFWANHDLYKQDFVSFLEGLEKRERARMYGENMSDEQIARLQKAEQVEKRLEEIEAQREHESKLGEARTTLKDELSEIERISKEYGIEYDDKTHNDLMQYCIDNKVQPQYVSSVFTKFALGEIAKRQSMRTQESTIKQLQENKKAGVLTSSKSSGGKQEPSFKDQISKLLKF
jgi:hypothetical protein